MGTITDYNKIPQRDYVYPASDRAKKLVKDTFAMDSLFSAVWPSQWSTPEGPEFHDVLGKVKDAGFNVLAACTSADSVGGDLQAELHALEF